MKRSNGGHDVHSGFDLQVPIKSLPQEWLWCETWCDEESKKVAKTIDLCNNPKTKEPKLTAARRIIAEWEDYDNEIKNLLNQLQNESRTERLSQSLATEDQSEHKHIEL